MLLHDQSGVKDAIVVFLSGCLIASMMVLALWFLDFDPIAALRDRSLSARPEAGLISDIGILFMVLAAVAALFGAWKSWSLPLALFGFFCGLFAIDDGFMIHEKFESSEILVFTFYGLKIGVALFLFRMEIGFFPRAILVGIAAFAASIVVDLLPSLSAIFLQSSDGGGVYLGGMGIVLEDVTKFGGIVVFSSFAIGQAFRVWSFAK